MVDTSYVLDANVFIVRCIDTFEMLRELRVRI